MKGGMYFLYGCDQKWISSTLLIISILITRTISSRSNCRTWCRGCVDISQQTDCFCESSTLFESVNRWSNYYETYRLAQGDKLYSFVTCRNIRTDSRLGEDVCVDNDCKYITFLNSNINVLRSNSFLDVSLIQEIYLNSSGIQQIQLGAFSGISKLQVLHLEDNKIDKISKGCLNSLISLEILDLHQNAISLIEDESFVGLTNLKILDLSLNILKTISVNLFEPLQNLEELSLSGNYLGIIDFDLHLLQILKTLDLSFNKIEIVEKCFNGTNINTLFLQYNEISHLEDYCFPTSLKTLNLGSNNLTELENEVLGSLSELTSLDASHNQIRNISIELFKDCEKVQSLDISRNEIDDLKTGLFSGVPNLIYLNISYLKIKTMDLHTFIPLTSLQIFDFHNNELDNIDTTIFTHLSSLEKIYIGGNNFSCAVIASIISLSKVEKFTVVYTKNFTIENVNGLPCKKQNISEIIHSKDYSSSYKLGNMFNGDWKIMENEIIANITTELHNSVKEIMNAEKIVIKNNLNEISNEHELVIQKYQNMLKTEKLDIESILKHFHTSDIESASKSIHGNIAKHFDAQNAKIEDSFIEFSKNLEKAIEKKVPKFEKFAINSFKNLYNSTKASADTLMDNHEINNDNSIMKNQMESLSISMEQLKMFILITCAVFIFFYVVKNVFILCWKRFRPEKDSFNVTHEMPILQNF